jgi:hypothetical protein
MTLICVSQRVLFTYLILIALGIYVYSHLNKQENMASSIPTSIGELQNIVTRLQEQLFQSQKQNQQCESSLQDLQSQYTQVVRAGNRSKYDDPLTPPQRGYYGGRLRSNSNYDYQQIGFVYSGNERYPLYGRPKYPGRSEKWEYYIIDESRNRLKIPFRSTNDNEMYDGDSINIPTLGDNFTVKIYEFEQFRYNPTI